MSDIPRRIDLQRNTPAELAIRAAMQAVELVGADVRLTEAMVLLQQARDKVADYVDENLGLLAAVEQASPNGACNCVYQRGTCEANCEYRLARRR